MNKFVITCPVCHSMCRPARVCLQAAASAVRAANDVQAEVLIFAVMGICLTVQEAARVVVSQSEAQMADSAWKAIRQKANALAASGDADMKHLAEEIRFADPMPMSIDGEIAAQVDALTSGKSGKNVQNLLKQLERRKLLSKQEK